MRPKEKRRCSAGSINTGARHEKHHSNPRRSRLGHLIGRDHYRFERCRLKEARGNPINYLPADEGKSFTVVSLDSDGKTGGTGSDSDSVRLIATLYLSRKISLSSCNSFELSS